MVKEVHNLIFYEAPKIKITHKVHQAGGQWKNEFSSPRAIHRFGTVLRNVWNCEHVIIIYCYTAHKFVLRWLLIKSVGLVLTRPKSLCLNKELSLPWNDNLVTIGIVIDLVETKYVWKTKQLLFFQKHLITFTNAVNTAIHNYPRRVHETSVHWMYLNTICRS